MYESYRSFASVYDEFMDGTDYHKTADQIQDMITRFGVSKPTQKRTGASEARDVLLAAEKNLVVDLGCGTGKFTEILADRGYDVMGIDLSEEMLGIALERRDSLRHRTLYLCQDMREFELYGTAGTFVSVGDSVNYLLTDEDMIKLFKRVNTFLFPGGIFVFDFKTLHLYRDVIGDNTIAEDREDCSFIWENWYDDESRINEYDLSLFIRETGVKEDDNLFRKYQEIHRQRGYTLEEMKRFAEEAGLTWIAEMDSDSMGPVSEESERILCVVRENGKKLPYFMR
ncbi:MAG: class I SAM-dependent methyltransferase [Lachnospiraceae bacterium]|nr:class I SAM-dependent methyltransferase [Lachnospiraceae bacterium]MBQ8328933.1 class I SAM-dependent methyltransferase [Lachnospiraceae bacterium]